MKILSIDTSTKNFSLALAKDGKVLRYRNIFLDKVLESSMIPAIHDLLKKAGITLSQLDGFAVGLGPGSFTSLRVGVSTMKAFSLTTGKPIVGICSLDAVAENVIDEPCDEICVMMDARRSMVYACQYQKKNGELVRKTEPMLTDVDKLLDHVKGCTLFVGDVVSLYQEKILNAYLSAAKQSPSCKALFAPPEMAVVKATKISLLAYRRFIKNVYDESGTLVPVYLYAQDCQVQPKLTK
jgi:tRNA threonylcarbamoyl adenosine modification protein YeaZ